MTSSISLTAINKTAKTWNWQGFPITYQQNGDNGVAVVLVHGFGASWGHWRKNLPVLAQDYRCYAICLKNKLPIALLPNNFCINDAPTLRNQGSSARLLSCSNRREQLIAATPLTISG